MAKVSIVFALLLIALGLTGYYYTGAVHPTALIPLWWGIAMGICGALAISRSELRRKIFMHINAGIGIIGFLGALISAIQGYGNARTEGVDPDYVAMTFKLVMAGILLIYINFCVQSFLKARRPSED